MKNNKKGFTLAELLVVVAIIAVLVAIAIPVFNGATEKAAKAADDANYRAAYASIQIANIDDELLEDAPTGGEYFQTDGTWGTSDGAVKGQSTANKDKGLKCTVTGTKYSVDWASVS